MCDIDVQPAHDGDIVFADLESSQQGRGQPPLLSALKTASSRRRRHSLSAMIVTPSRENSPRTKSSSESHGVGSAGFDQMNSSRQGEQTVVAAAAVDHEGGASDSSGGVHSTHADSVHSSAPQVVSHHSSSRAAVPSLSFNTPSHSSHHPQQDQQQEQQEVSSRSTLASSREVSAAD